MIKNKISNNKKHLNKNKTLSNCFLVSRGRYLNDICNIFGILAANQILNLKTFVISDFHQKNYNKLFSHFGFKKFIYIHSYKRIYLDILLNIKTLMKSVVSFYKLNKHGFYWFINDFKLNNIKIGDLIYDTYTRKNHRYLRPKKDIYFFKILFEGIFRFLKLLNAVDHYKPKIIFIGTNGYSYNDGLLMRIGLSHKIHTLEVQPNFLIKSEEFQTNYGRDYLKFASNFIQNIKQKKINKHYLNRKKLRINPHYTDTYFVANKFKKEAKVKNFLKIFKKDYKKKILIAPHSFSDAPHINGKLIFEDFYAQFVETLKFINKNKNEKILWIIKHHPGNFIYKENKIFKNIVLKYLAENIILCPKKINTNDLIPLCDHVITTNGSIGIEFACEGKMPILGGFAPYSNLGFTFDPKNKEHYFSTLNKIHKLKNLNNKQILIAKKALYFLDTANYKNHLEKSKILNFDNFFKFYNKGLLKNKFINRQKIFIKNSFKNLKKNKITNDPYFISIKKQLENYLNND